MKFSLREIFSAWVTALVVIIGLTYIIAMPRIREWQTKSKDLKDLQRRVATTERLVEQKSLWENRLAGERQMLPSYPVDKDVTADMMILIEGIARQHGITLLSRDLEKEIQHGTLYELSVNCKWEGNLKAIVEFLYDIQQKGAMLDVSQLSIAPNEKRVLRGGLSINSSYSRPAAGTTGSGESRPAKTAGK